MAVINTFHPEKETEEHERQQAMSKQTTLQAQSAAHEWVCDRQFKAS